MTVFATRAFPNGARSWVHWGPYVLGIVLLIHYGHIRARAAYGR